MRERGRMQAGQPDGGRLPRYSSREFREELARSERQRSVRRGIAIAIAVVAVAVIAAALLFAGR